MTYPPGQAEIIAPTRSRRRPLILILAAVLIAAALVWVFRAWSYGRSHEKTDNAQVDGHIVPVLAKVGGYVKSVSVAENDSVRVGQLLVQIDEAEYRQRLIQAEADLAAARATAGEGASTRSRR